MASKPQRTRFGVFLVLESIRCTSCGDPSNKGVRCTVGALGFFLCALCASDMGVDLVRTAADAIMDFSGE